MWKKAKAWVCCILLAASVLSCYIVWQTQISGYVLVLRSAMRTGSTITLSNLKRNGHVVFVFPDLYARLDVTALMPPEVEAIEMRHNQTQFFPSRLEESIQQVVNAAGRFVFVCAGSGCSEAVGLTQYLRDQRLPMPLGLMLIEPTLSIEKVPALGETCSQSIASLLLHPRAYIRCQQILKLQEAGGREASHRYVSPISGHARLTHFPPVFILSSSFDLLQTDATAFAGMCEEQEVDVVVRRLARPLYAQLRREFRQEAGASREWIASRFLK